MIVDIACMQAATGLAIKQYIYIYMYASCPPQTRPKTAEAVREREGESQGAQITTAFWIPFSILIQHLFQLGGPKFDPSPDVGRLPRCGQAIQELGQLQQQLQEASRSSEINSHETNSLKQGNST